jgi:arabinose-5-phosphate isomerase
MTARNLADRAARVLAVEAEGIRGLRERLDGNFDRAIAILRATRGKVVVTGMGKSGIIGHKIAATLASTGTPAFFLHPGEGIHGDVGMLHRGDAVIVLSNSGETEEVLRLLPVFKRLGLPLIALTGNPASTLSRHADAVLDVGVREEACPLGLAPTASTTAALAMGDALAVVLFEEKGFSAEDFALLHPGGALGRKLLTVSDLMHTGDELPLVTVTTLLKDALFTISAKRLGVTGVMDSQGRLAGIITDGDVRRAMAHGTDIFTATAGQVMTASPKRIAPTDLAAAALQKMEAHAITSLLVCDPADAQRLLGIVHVHDLLKAGVG